MLKNLINKLLPSAPGISDSGDMLPTGIRLGIWGPKGSGKSTYIAMLYRELQRSGEWEVVANKPATDFALEVINRMRQEGRYPKPTLKAEPKIYQYEVIRKKNNKSQIRVCLEFLDIAGEVYENLEYAKTDMIPANSHNKITLIEYLSECHGIVFLLDPEQEGENSRLYEGLLYQLMQELQGSFGKLNNQNTFRLQSYMAFCITKVDKPEIWKRYQSAQELGREMLGESMYEMINNQFCLPNRLKFFSISSVGYAPHSDGSYDSSPSQPSSENTQPISQSTESSNLSSTESQSPATASNQGNPQSKPSSRPRLRLNTSQAARDKTDQYKKSSHPSTRAAEKTSPAKSATSSKKASNNKAFTSSEPLTPDEKSVSDTSAITIRTDIELNPFNIIPPIDWLISEIQSDPPKVSSKVSFSLSTSEKAEADIEYNSPPKLFADDASSPAEISE